MKFVHEFMRFIITTKKYWLLPVFMSLLLVGGLLVLSKGSVVAPLIYTIF
jgi:hypothetical protein